MGAWRNRLIPILAAIVLAGGLGAGGALRALKRSEEGKTSPYGNGVEGTLVLELPCADDPRGKCCRPGSAALGIAHDTPGNKQLAACIRSDSRGHFRVSLPPGSYTIQPFKSVVDEHTYFSDRATSVTVRSGEYTKVELSLYRIGNG